MATMAAVTPDRVLSRRQVSLLHVPDLPIVLSPTTGCAPQHRFNTLPISVLGLRPLDGSGLHHSLAGSPRRPAESRWSSYGPMVHLQLLSTPPHGDAVTFSFRPESACLKGTCTPRIEYTCRRTRP